jgi:ribosomal protein S12 methylthiotransferase accessory factor
MHRPNAEAVDAEPATSLALAMQIAVECGVTRLADVTALDRIGIHTWQAIRPWSRNVSVHQGKGFDPVSAQIGACMEAIECAFGECWDAPSHRAHHADLPAHERSDAADDFADRRGVPDAEMDWIAAERVGGGRLWVPWWAVSLDFTRPSPAGIDIISTGQGAGFDVDRASWKGLLEVIERDAMGEWLRRNMVERSFDAMDCSTVPFGWFKTLAERLAARRIELRLFAIPAVIAIPVFAAELFDAGSETLHRFVNAGICCDWNAEAALSGAIVEAAQSRLGYIAGSRDDLDLATTALAKPSPGYGLALGRGRQRRAFADFCGPAELPEGFRAGFDAAVAALAAVGYDKVARVIVSPPGSPVVVARLFVPGLGSTDRARRPPLP